MIDNLMSNNTYIYDNYKKKGFVINFMTHKTKVYY